MSKTAYNIHLKGYVGGEDFDRNAVDDMLAENEGKQVNVLIDSLGGSLATGLSISAAFQQHGNVAVHFVGLNASAATIASLGAAHISIDAGAMYLVHKCSMALFSALQSAFGDNEWGSLNSDQFATLIADCEKIKADLDKLDLNVASLYAKKCRKPVADLLALMKAGGWLTTKEALDWGFVDEIIDLADEPAPKLTDALASSMASEGMPIPNIPVADTDREGRFGKFLTAIASLFRPNRNSISSAMNKTYTFLCAVVGLSAIALTDNVASLSDQQLARIDNALKEKDEAIAAKDRTIADLQAKLDKKPAEPSKQVVEDSKPGGDPAPKNDVEQFVDTYNSARALFDLLTKVVITVPPLRDCPEDILGIARQVIDDICHEQGINSVRLTRPAERRLSAYHWPGNLRELHSTLYRAIHRCSSTIHLEHLVFASAFSEADKERNDCDKLISALIRTGGNIQHTADLLDVSRPTVYRRIDKYKIDTENLAQYVQS